MRTRRLVTAATLAAAASAAPTVEYIARAQGIAASQVTLVGPIGACFTSCQLPLGFVQFEDLTPGPYWVSRINSPTFLTSVAACMSTHCSPTEIEEGWERLGLFRDFGAPGTPVPPLDEVLVRMGDVHQVPIIDVFDHMGETFNYTILSSDSNYKDAIRTQVSYVEKRRKVG
jgi:hypothetical protein